MSAASTSKEETRSKTPKPGDGLLLELCCRDHVVFSVNTSNLKDVTTIGKAEDNDWQIPAIDGSCAAYHAKLEVSDRTVEIVAEPGEIMYFHGEPITHRTLRINDRVAFGDSELFVKKVTQRSQYACDVHRLEVIGGERDGSMIRLDKSPFRIGSAPDNDLVLNSDVVSLHHAEIRITATGETWLKDLRSSNGTFVNGERLKNQERMLMDSDAVSLAQFDFQFLDRNVVHTRTQFGRKLLIMGATVLLALIGSGGFYLSSPSTESVINAVDFYLFRDQFDAAERMLAKMPDSRGFQRYEKQYHEYLTRIPYCRKAYDTMMEFRDSLKNSRWNDAAECFGKLDLKNPEVWNPANPNTAERVQEITHARQLLAYLLSLRDFNSSPYNSKTELRNLWARLIPLSPELKADAAKAPDYLKPLHKELQALIAELDHNVTLLNEIDQQGEDFAAGADQKSLNQFSEFLNKGEKTATGVVRVYIRDLIFMLGIFRGSLNELRSNDLALFDLRMNDVKPVSFISADDCLNFPRLYQARIKMEEHYRCQLKARENWLGIQRLLGRYQLKFGSIPEEIRFFSNQQQLERIMALSELTRNPASRIPADYEQVFGERYFYEVIQQTVHSTNNIYASDLVPDMKNAPKCVLLKDLYRGLTEALLWMDLPQNKWLLQGRMKETRAYYEQLLATREPILRIMENIAAKNRTNRKYYLAMSAYFFFAPVSPDIPDKMRAFSADWRKFRQQQQTLLLQYDPMKPALSQQVRDTIVSTGIPGDPVFNWIRNLK